jgi:polyisoprenyl-teichoic acid--peptidoglycan teichoic acid transferase
MAARSKVIAVAIVVVLVAAIGGGTALVMNRTGLAPGSSTPPVAVATPFETPTDVETPLPPGESPGALPPEPSASPTETLAPSPAPAGADPIMGTDGRFTVLLLGSDYRPAHPGNRTDAIMVVSVDPQSQKTAAFSIPRDTRNFPLTGGGSWSAKVNSLYQDLANRTGNGGKAMERTVGKALGIEIDGYVFIGFDGVRRLVNAVGGVKVTLDAAYYDSYFWVNAHHQGWGLPKGTSHLNGIQALIMARSRKGDNDFNRTRRQQLLVMGALAKVRQQGVAVLPKLAEIAASTVRTDLPLKQLPALYAIVTRANLDTAKQVVFGPRSFASALSSDFAIDIDACKAWIKKNFPPVHANGSWPPASAAPASAAPAASGSAAP